MCEDSDELRSRRLSKHFMKPSDYDKIPLSKILYFVGGMGLLAEWKRWGMNNRPKMIAVQGSLYAPIQFNLI
jgi:hypothetical protein